MFIFEWIRVGEFAHHAFVFVCENTNQSSFIKLNGYTIQRQKNSSKYEGRRGITIARGITYQVAEGRVVFLLLVLLRSKDVAEIAE